MAITFVFASSVSFAEGNHLAKAIMDTQAATRSATGEGVAEHAEMALTHVKAELESSGAANPDEHLAAALTSLDGAIEEGRKGNLDLARKAAREAKVHLKAAP